MDLEERARTLYRGAALAPMVRACSTPLRTLALQYGADFVYTEELIDRSITSTVRVVNITLNTIDYVKDTSLLSKKVQKRLQLEHDRPSLLLRIDPKVEADKLVVQIGSGNPELALAAAKHVYQDFAGLDINMGCPKKFSVSGGMGSALLSDPDRAVRIIKALRSEIPRPVSCKIRLLKDTAATLHYMEAMISAGVHAIAIHARRVGDESTQPADWKSLEEILGLIRPKYPNLPLLLNGDFYTRPEISDMLEKTGADGVLLARPALYNTSLFKKPSEELEEKTNVVQEYLRHAVKYDAHYKNVKYVVCEMMSNRRTPSPRTPFLPQVFPGGQSVGSVCNCHSLQEMLQLWNVNWSENKPTNGNNQNASTSLSSGEHKYDDSYLLERLDEPKKGEPEAKRVRLDDDDGNGKISDTVEKDN
jgi:tRNA-dihydrouridine synthase 2